MNSFIFYSFLKEAEGLLQSYSLLLVRWIFFEVVTFSLVGTILELITFIRYERPSLFLLISFLFIFHFQKRNHSRERQICPFWCDLFKKSKRIPWSRLQLPPPPKKKRKKEEKKNIRFLSNNSCLKTFQGFLNFSLQG